MAKKGLFVLSVMFCAVAPLVAKEKADTLKEPKPPKRIFNETETQRVERMAWWLHDRFGMFIHFGLYSLPARHEWVKSREAMDTETYNRKYLPRFNPDLYDAKKWAKTAKAAGMKYAVLTTKHHEGFCMWDTATTDYKITKTGFGRDVVREFVDAFRAEGIKVGFYFSIMDWYHPDYTVDYPHPLFRRIEGDKKAAVDRLNANRDMDRYRKYMFDQVRELVTGYGRIDIMWFDYTPKGEFGKSWRDWDAVELLKMTRKFQPHCIVDSRLDLMESDDGWDFVTPEQCQAAEWPTVRGKKVPWETCQTFSGSWGYHRDENTWKSMPQLIGMLSETVSKGGNLILNVGPTARGEFDYRAMERLEGFAKWMHYNSRSIYGCTQAPAGFTAPNGTVLTYNPKSNVLYVHLINYPTGLLQLDFYGKIEYAQFLHDGSEIFIRKPASMHGQSGDLKPVGGLVLPMLKPNVTIPVVEIFLKSDAI